MNHTYTNQSIVSKTTYEAPQLNIIQYSDTDIIRTSGDGNQGEWDPQNID